ncbi:MAG: CYTH domain-containing protein [Patescibacteria group bacterium]|mgnify:CR=1 FL=1
MTENPKNPAEIGVEYEATFTGIDKDDVRGRLRTSGAELVRPEFLQKRVVFNLPKGHEIPGGWLRVRDEGDKITMSLKIVDGNKIEDQKELCLRIDDFETGRKLLATLGAEEKAYQETTRELWRLHGVEIVIDGWPFLEPLVEIEGAGEDAVQAVAKALGFSWADARFCAVGTLYAEKYNLPEDVINNQTPRIVFGMENPFLR